VSDSFGKQRDNTKY